MKVSKGMLNDIASSTGFRADIIEKVIQLLHLLNTFNEHPFLRTRWALKGGTALNLFVLKMPRLSVDIDLNYIGAVDRETMMSERPKVEQAVQGVFSREGFTVKRIPSEHAGGKWRLAYSSVVGEIGNLDVDLNFMFRQPLWDLKIVNSHPLGHYQAKDVPVVDIHELTAGKLAALFSRHEARDLFDAQQVLGQVNLDQRQLRIAFVVYGAMNRKDWRTISLDDVSFGHEELKQKLIPVIQPQFISGHEKVVPIGQNLVEECQRKLSIVFPLLDNEIKFLDFILEKGEIEPSLLTPDTDLQERIKRHPMLQWKAMNARKYFGVR